MMCFLNKHSDLLNDAMIVELESTKLDQFLNDYNWIAFMEEEPTTIEKKKTYESMHNPVNKRPRSK